MSIQESIKWVSKGEVAHIIFDLVGEKVNKLSSPIMIRFKEIVDEVKASSHKVVVIESAKKNMFIAGADIEEIKKITRAEDFMDAVTQAHEILNTLEDLPQVTIAAIDGPCLGGGCELALACDYRITTQNPATKIGLPETKLGIIPGFGGCVRLPRVVGLQKSLDIILAGKAVDGVRAEKMGLVDRAVPTEQLSERVEELVQEILAGKKGKRQKVFQPKTAPDIFLESFMGRPIVFSQAKKSVMKLTKGFYPAPLKAIDVIKATYGSSNRERSLLKEAQGFCEVAVSEVSKHLISLFYLMEGVKKQTGVKDKNVKPLPVHHMSVLGAGIMGGGIAYVAADKGIEVRMKDISYDAIAKGLKAARDLWQKKIKRRRMTRYELAQKMGHVSGGIDFSGFGKTDLVVEAIVEDMNIKKSVIEETAKHCKAHCIMATNTSSLSVNEMSQAHPHPENFLGMHFFNPVDKMPLVEVIRGDKTSDVATATVFELAKKMGKTPVVVKDGPGFLVNRLLLPLLSEALFLLEEGVDIQVVDRFYTHTFGMPMGPYRLMDEVGLDTCVKVLKIFRDSLGERIEVSDLAFKIEGTGRLGKKNNKGFYHYDEKGKETSVDTSVYSSLGLSDPKATLSSKECIERGLLMMINEASRAIYEDKIVESPADCDLAMIMGTGFPPFRGGLLRYADSLGSEYIVSELEEYASRLGIRFKPSQTLIQMSKNKSSFY